MYTAYHFNAHHGLHIPGTAFRLLYNAIAVSLPRSTMASRSLRTCAAQFVARSDGEGSFTLALYQLSNWTRRLNMPSNASQKAVQASLSLTYVKTIPSSLAKVNCSSPASSWSKSAPETAVTSLKRRPLIRLAFVRKTANRSCLWVEPSSWAMRRAVEEPAPIQGADLLLRYCLIHAQFRAVVALEPCIQPSRNRDIVCASKTCSAVRLKSAFAYYFQIFLAFSICALGKLYDKRSRDQDDE